jgi:hypothetical protein
MKYVLIAWLHVNGQIHTEVLDHDLTLMDCMIRMVMTREVELEVRSDEIVPLTCEKDRQI